MNKKAFYIANWDDLFEVTERGHVWKAGENKLTKPLPYLRIACNERGIGNWKRIAKKICHENGFSFAQFLGVYLECLVIAANQDAHSRGWLLDFQQQPLDFEGVAEWTDISVEEVTQAFTVLLDPRLAIIKEANLSLRKQEEIKQARPYTPIEQPGNTGEHRGTPDQINTIQLNKNQIRIAPVCLQIPTQSNFESYTITQERLETLKARHPKLDVESQLQEILKRLQDNPKLRPEPKKAEKFLNSCLENAGGEVAKATPDIDPVWIMSAIHRKWPQVSKPDIGDFFENVLPDDTARLHALAELIPKAKTWEQFTRLASTAAA